MTERTMGIAMMSAVIADLIVNKVDQKVDGILANHERNFNNAIETRLSGAVNAISISDRVSALTDMAITDAVDRYVADEVSEQVEQAIADQDVDTKIEDAIDNAFENSVGCGGLDDQISAHIESRVDESNFEEAIDRGVDDRLNGVDFAAKVDETLEQIFADGSIDVQAPLEAKVTEMVDLAMREAADRLRPETGDTSVQGRIALAGFEVEKSEALPVNP